MKITVDQTYEFKEKCMQILDEANEEVLNYGVSNSLFNKISAVFIGYTMMIDDADDDACKLLQEDLLEVGKYCRVLVDRLDNYEVYDDREYEEIV